MNSLRNVMSLFFTCVFILVLQGCSGGGHGGSSTTAPAITNINGAISGIGATGDLFTVNGSNFGTLSRQTTGFSVDFRDMTTNQVVASAQVDFASGKWTATQINGTVPSGLSSGTFYKLTVSTTGGTSNAVNFLVTPTVAFNSSTTTWNATNALSQGLQGFPTVIAPVFTSLTSAPTNYIYTLGGNIAAGPSGNKTSNVTSVSFNQLVNSSGALANVSWQATTALPDNRGFAAGVLANGFNSQVTGNGTIYVLGGLDGTGVATSTVYFASISSNGTIPAAGAAGTWATTTPLPQALFAAKAVIFQGRIYVAGGNNAAGAPVSNVYAAQINGDGTLGTWQTLTNMPTALAYHQLVAAGGFLYILGGDPVAANPVTNALVTPQDFIYFSRVSLTDGTLSAWTTNSSGMGSSREKFSAVVAGSTVVVTGGLYSGTPGANESRLGTINADGSLAVFNALTGTNTISIAGSYNPYNHSSALFVDTSGNAHILVLGGADVATGNLHSEVWYQN